MRAVISTVLFLVALLSGSAVAGTGCIYGDETVAISEAQTSSFSVFRGISLASTPDETVAAGRALGLVVEVSTYVGSSAVASIDFYTGNDWIEVAVASFDRAGHMLRLSLKDRFFCSSPVFVRRFAEEVFARYGVSTKATGDDVCFQDVTCFRGVSKFGEQFLILRIGTTAELYVRP